MVQPNAPGAPHAPLTLGWPPQPTQPSSPCLASAMQEGIAEVPAPTAAPQHLTQPQLHPRADPDPALVLVLCTPPAGCTKVEWRHGLQAGVRSHNDRVPALHPQAHTACSHSTPRRALTHTLLRSPPASRVPWAFPSHSVPVVGAELQEGLQTPSWGCWAQAAHSYVPVPQHSPCCGSSPAAESDQEGAERQGWWQR